MRPIGMQRLTLVGRVGDHIVFPEHSGHVLPHQNPQAICPVIPPVVTTHTDPEADYAASSFTSQSRDTLGFSTDLLRFVLHSMHDACQQCLQHMSTNNV